MNRVIAQVQQQLFDRGLLLNEHGVLTAYETIDQLWRNNVELLIAHRNSMGNANSEVEYLIIGEAPAAIANYFYSQDAPATTFLNPTYFSKDNKSELITFFNRNGILVFDLYPLILPTFIYDNISMSGRDSNYIRAMEEYYRNHLTGLINNNTKIILRFSKLQFRMEWSILMHTIGRNRNDFIPIWGKGMSVNPESINDVFGHLF